MAASGPFFLGVDGGGTRTRAVVASADLVPRGRGASGPASAAAAPVPRVVEAVLEAAEDALAAAGVPRDAVEAISCGIAGVDGTAARGRLTEALEETFGRGRVLVSTDARIALAGATEGPVDAPGVVLIAGTGAVAFGRNEHGLEERAGGWGALIGDEGSGFEIARRGLRAVVRDLDGRGPRTRMRETLFSSEGTRSPVELIQRLYRSGGGPADVAAYFPLVVSAARAGDGVARAILEEAGEELALAATTVIRKLGLAGTAVPVATVGGVFNAGALVLDALRRDLLAVAPRALLRPPAFPPELGAIRLALAARAVEGEAAPA